MHPILTYGVLVVAAALFAVGLWAGGEAPGRRFPRLARLSLVLQLAAVLAAYGALRPGRGVSARAAMQASAASGRPVLLDLYSNF